MDNFDLLASLGIFTYRERDLSINPENTIISIVRGVKDDENPAYIVTLLLTWLKEYGEYIDIESLKEKIDNLDIGEAQLLWAISNKCVSFKILKFKTIADNCKNKVVDSKEISFTRDYAAEISGVDEDFKIANVKILPLKQFDTKKLLPKKEILKNKYLKDRISES